MKNIFAGIIFVYKKIKQTFHLWHAYALKTHTAVVSQQSPTVNCIWKEAKL